MTEYRDNYLIKSDKEWKEILANHLTEYYPRFPNKDSEETYLRIVDYFQDKPNKPTFIRNRSKKLVKLENKLFQLKQALQLTDNLTKFEELQIKLDIKLIESKLKIRR